MSSDLAQLQAQLDAIHAEIAQVTANTPAPVAISGEGEPTHYRIQPGDSLASIAAAFETTVDALMATNVGTLITPDSLIIGQSITLP